MEILDNIFKLILTVLESFIADSYVGGIFWMFILVSSVLFAIYFVRSVRIWLH